MEQSIAQSQQELGQLKQQRQEREAEAARTPSADDVRRAAAAEAEQLWNVGSPAPTSSPRPMPSLGELLGSK
jgi:hypothetical protein